MLTNPTQVREFITSLSEPIQSQLLSLHLEFSKLDRSKKLWFDQGVDEKGKVTNNPTIGYGQQTLVYANGKTKPFFRVGLCPTASGISVYILGLKDKGFLSKSYSQRIGKAKVTSYVIKFKHVNEIDVDVLYEAVRFGLEYE